ncbi:MAG: ribonuclease III [Oscillospiraceae bacterium]|jgi:ribonuclease-3|nr:ribonuclease III [Oscillospiraceae bacterium]
MDGSDSVEAEGTLARSPDEPPRQNCGFVGDPSSRTQDNCGCPATRAGTESIAASFGITGVDPHMLITALTHSTAALALGVPSFQRLEFLGDAVLELCVTRALYDKFPDLQEGALTLMRIAYVRRSSLAEAAGKLHMERYIRVAKAEKYIVEPDNPKVMADSLEAVIAAVYLSKGLDAADSFIKRLFRGFENAEEFADIPLKQAEHTILSGPQPASDSSFNWKSALQELVLHNGGIAPTYELIDKKGPTHKPLFVVVCRIGRTVAGHGKGNNKKQAEQAAAREAFLMQSKKHTEKQTKEE